MSLFSDVPVATLRSTVNTVLSNTKNDCHNYTFRY